jgi:hypothetical protein
MYTTMHSPKMTMNLQHISHKEYFFQNLHNVLLSYICNIPEILAVVLLVHNHEIIYFQDIEVCNIL